MRINHFENLSVILIDNSVYIMNIIS